jgi:hypothetical protein
MLMLLDVGCNVVEGDYLGVIMDDDVVAVKSMKKLVQTK